MLSRRQLQALVGHRRWIERAFRCAEKASKRERKRITASDSVKNTRATN